MTYRLEIAARNIRIQRLVRDLAAAYHVNLGATFEDHGQALAAAQKATATLRHLIVVPVQQPDERKMS